MPTFKLWNAKVMYETPTPRGNTLSIQLPWPGQLEYASRTDQQIELLVLTLSCCYWLAVIRLKAIIIQSEWTESANELFDHYNKSVCPGFCCIVAQGKRNYYFFLSGLKTEAIFYWRYNNSIKMDRFGKWTFGPPLACYINEIYKSIILFWRRWEGKKEHKRILFFN